MNYAKNKYGMNTQALEIIYKGVIIPILSYACPIWIDNYEKKYISLSFERIQRLIALRMCRAYRTVSSDALNVIANLMPIDLVLKQRAVEYYMKKGIATDLTEYYFRDYRIDFQNIQKPIKHYDLPHPARDIKLSITEPQTGNLSIFIRGFKSEEREPGCAY
jgi:hypothetical protein